MSVAERLARDLETLEVEPHGKERSAHPIDDVAGTGVARVARGTRSLVSPVVSDSAAI